MPDPILIITDAGRAEAVTAAGSGLDVEITEIGIGTGQWLPDATATALQNELKRLTADGAEKSQADSVTLQFRDTSADVYDAYEIGFYLASGTLFAVYASDTDIVASKPSALKLVWGMTLVLSSLPDDSVTVTPSLDFVPPAASETVEGILEIATQAEADAGTDDVRAITAKKLKDHSTLAHFPSGTRMLFQQSAAPTGWTKDTSLNEHAVRIVSGAASSGGSVNFSTVFGRQATDGHTLTSAQSGVGAHYHIQGVPASSNLGTESNLTQYGWTSTGSNRKTSQYGDPSNENEYPNTSTASANASSPHSHNIDLRVRFADVIVATKD